ncbi:MAG TPA: ATP-binding protein [Polyangiaceae bacterium]|nr:ATP-binding protein [Polyangiaceae bacterium]
MADPKGPSGAPGEDAFASVASERSGALAMAQLDLLRESILRRIMRAACAVGIVAMAAAAVLVKPVNWPAELVGSIATLIVLGATLLPTRLLILSAVYPWALVAVGLALTAINGPTAAAILLIAGGLFIASLVLSTRQLVALSLVSVAAGIGLAAWAGPAMRPETTEIWINAAGSMAAVVLPAAIAGRMLMGALTRALQQRETLVQQLVEDGRAREATLTALENTRAQLTHAQKMELVGQMAGGIAHDMNNALTAVMGGASLLDDSVAEDRDRILEASAYAAKLTHQLMVFARRDTSQPRPIDLSATVRGALQSIRRIIPSEIGLIQQLSTEPIIVVADPTQILQVLLNLAGNARDAMPDGGRMTLRLALHSATKQAELEVSDTGPGIPEELLDQIFEPFFTTKPAGKGTGLGLATVKQLVETMGGSIDVQSAPGAGASFIVRLATTTLEVTPEPPQSSGVKTRSGTVLVVDDDVRVRALVYTALERLGYQVLEAATPGAALEAVRAQPNGVDLVVTDVVLPDGGGAVVIEHVRGICPKARVLVMSGYNDDETLRRGIQRGAFPFIAKPFTAADLGRAVERAFDR